MGNGSNSWFVSSDDGQITFTDCYTMSQVRKILGRNVVSLCNSALFLAVGLAFVILIASVLTSKHRRLSTFVIGFALLITYTAILFGLMDPHWQVLEPTKSRIVVSSYSIFDMGLFAHADLLVKIGLTHFNVSYAATKLSLPSMGFVYEEKFSFIFDSWISDSDDGQIEAKMVALQRGLPNAITILAEYLGTYDDGFLFGRQLTDGGRECYLTLTFALCVTCLTTLFFIVIPEYGFSFIVLVGLLLITSNVVYWARTSGPFDMIYVEGIQMEFMLGRTFYFVLIIGLLDVLIGVTVLILIRLRLCSVFSTFLELNYDTPWSHQLLQEDSKNRRRKSMMDNHNDGAAAFRRSIRKLRQSIRIRSRPSPVGKHKTEKNFSNVDSAEVWVEEEIS